MYPNYFNNGDSFHSKVTQDVFFEACRERLNAQTFIQPGAVASTAPILSYIGADTQNKDLTWYDMPTNDSEFTIWWSVGIDFRSLPILEDQAANITPSDWIVAHDGDTPRGAGYFGGKETYEQYIWGPSGAITDHPLNISLQGAASVDINGFSRDTVCGTIEHGFIQPNDSVHYGPTWNEIGRVLNKKIWCKGAENNNSEWEYWEGIGTSNVSMDAAKLQAEANYALTASPALTAVCASISHQEIDKINGSVSYFAYLKAWRHKPHITPTDLCLCEIDLYGPLYNNSTPIVYNVVFIGTYAYAAGDITLGWIGSDPSVKPAWGAAPILNPGDIFAETNAGDQGFGQLIVLRYNIVSGFTKFV